MRVLFLSLFLISSQALALDAVVMVLEAPYFSKPDIGSKIVQYARKGDIVKVHPSLDNTSKFDHLAPEPRKLSQIRKSLKKVPELNEDRMFKGDIDDTFSLQDDWIAVLDRQGIRRFMKTEHLYVYFNDSREFVQSPHRYDETDYRIEEPLPKNYPLKAKTGYRGQFLVGATQPNSQSYPYNNAAKTKGYSNPIDVAAVILRETGEKRNDRFYLGGMLNFRQYKNEFTLVGRSAATEDNYRLGLGPYISYDAYKGEKNRINLYGTITAYLLNITNITQTTFDGRKDTRNYQAYSFTPRIGFQYHRKNIFPEIDFVAGTGIEMELPSTYKAKDGAQVDGIWQNNGEDKFKTRLAWNLGAFIGIQSAY